MNRGNCWDGWDGIMCRTGPAGLTTIIKQHVRKTRGGQITPQVLGDQEREKEG